MVRIRSLGAGFLTCIAALGLAALLPRAAGATLLAVDLAEIAGADSFLTRDTESGLDWLDVNLTAGMSFNDIVGGAPVAGGALNGLNPMTGVFAANPFR